MAFIWLSIAYTLAYPKFIAFKIGISETSYGVENIYQDEKEVIFNGLLVLILLALTDTFVSMFKWGLTQTQSGLILFLGVIALVLYGLSTIDEDSFIKIFKIMGYFILAIKAIGLIVIYNTNNINSNIGNNNDL